MKVFRGLGSIPARLADFVVGRPFLVVAVLLILTATAGFSARNLRFDFNPDAVFDNQNKVIKDAEQFNLDFGGNENVIIIGFVATGKSDVLSPAALTWQAETVHAFEHLPHVVRVESLISMETPHVTFSLPPKMTYEPIISETPVSSETADTLRERLAQTEMPFGSLVSKDEKMSAEMVVFEASQQEFDAMEAMVKNVDDTLAKFPVPDGYRAVVSGLPVLRVGIVRDLGKDQARLMPLAGILYLITLALAFRSLSGSLLPLFAVGQGLIWTFGVMALWGQPLNIISNILPCMLLINGVSNSIHVLTRYSEEAVQPGVSRKDATRRTIRQMLVACLGAFATAAVGFYVLRTASSPVLQSFGSQAAMGLSFLYLTVILTLGALLPFFKPPAFQDSPAWLAFSRALATVGNSLIRWRWTTVGVFVAIAALALWRARTVEINSSSLETYDESNPTIQTLRLLENHLSGLLPLEISLKAEKPGLFYKPDIYRKVVELQQFALHKKPVLFARSYLDFFNEINRPFSSGDDSPQAAAPDKADEERDIDRGRLFLRRVADEMRYWEFMTHDEKHARILLKIRDVGTRDTLALVRTLDAKMAQLF
ncbi:MAG TPA: MMPL family transporter, partial [Planctomycetaceae bacterium]|nr:MMPL family transporter [Planctomycetaceae bacterium]